jgi:hypothetical protein
MQRTNLFPDRIDIKIISAKFGLIDASTPIPLYDLRMNLRRARELRPTIQRGLKELLAKVAYCEIYVDLGVDYLPVLEDFVPREEIQMVLANGRIGERLHKLKEWLASH